MTTYLCTCGTSAAKNLPRDPRFDASWVDALGGIEAAADAVYASFRSYGMNDDLLVGIVNEDMHRYRVAQAEALLLLDWVKKFAKAYVREA